MPVFTRLEEGVLVIVADGDFTVGELTRAGERGLADAQARHPVPVLLDLSGAARLERKEPHEVAATREVFSDRPDETTRLAILVTSGRATELFRNATSDPHAPLATDTRVFSDRAEALRWLGRQGT